MNITVYGSGYVGLVTAACLAQMGNSVYCVDVDEARVARLRKGEVPIRERGLDEIVAQGLRSGALQFGSDVAGAVAHGVVQFVAVGTPAGADGAADLKYVLNVARGIGDHLQDYRVVVNKSTVPVGTVDTVREVIAERLAARNVTQDFDVVSNPEFLKEGSAVEDFMKPDRIIIGCESARGTALMEQLYAPFNRKNDRVLLMDPRSAELTKYAANAMLATKISVMNEFANIAERLGADIEWVRRGIGSDPRIGYHFIYPGAGYGGSCFPKDVSALAHIAERAGYPTEILRAVESVNARQKRRLVERIQAHFGDTLAGRTIALWGLAFKPGTDDMREAASRVIMEALWAAGARVQAHDPAAMEETRRIYGERDDLVLSDNPWAATEAADALVLITEWNIYRSPDLARLKQRLRSPVIFDGRNVYDPAVMAAEGFTYYAIGRPVVGDTARGR